MQKGQRRLIGGEQCTNQMEYVRYYKHKVTPNKYLELLAEQGGVCALCLKPFDEKLKPSIDHDHKCCPGKTSCGNCVRGLLHLRCNALLGMCQDNIDVLRAAINYLSRKRK